MNKNRQIISELKDFFKHNDSSKAVNAVSNVMDKLVIQAQTVGPVKNPNCKFTFVQLVKLLVLFPFFSIKMLCRAIMEGLRFDYLLVDSWFPCAELLRFIHSRHIKCHIIGMIKMGKTKYETALGNLSAPDIIKRLEKAKATKRNRSIGYTCASIKAWYAGMDVQLFFYKKGNGSWNALITTDMGIDAKRTFELYARRWCIEVAHKEMKGLLNLGKCQCVDFAGQIAALSLCMIQYNILGTVKRFESYETIGSLFTELTGEELTVIQRIWGLIIKVINVIVEFISCDPFELTENVINNNHQIKAVKMAFDRLDLAAAAA